jgi:hypothetical protein
VWSLKKMKVATFLLNEDRKLSPNEVIYAGKRAYSRAVLTYTDAVAILLHPGYCGETKRLASAAQWISE